MARHIHWITWVFSGSFFCLDQLLKLVARTYPDVVIDIIPGLFGWRYFENPGIAFGIPVPLIVVVPVSILIIGGLMHIRQGEKENKLLNLALWLIFFGAISNIVDRIVYGFTIDYIRIIASVANLADGMVLVGGMLAAYSWGGEDDTWSSQSKRQSTTD